MGTKFVRMGPCTQGKCGIYGVVATKVGSQAIRFPLSGRGRNEPDGLVGGADGGLLGVGQRRLGRAGTGVAAHAKAEFVRGSLEGGAPVRVDALDGLRDEDVECATRLNQANVPREIHVYPGVPHGTAMFPVLYVNENMIRDVDGYVRRLLGAGTDSHD
jgi:hypothetical protein